MTAEAGSFKLGSDSSYVEITFGSEDDGDMNLGVDISSAGFSGGNGIWVVRSDFTKFCRQLQKLDSTLKGEAILEAMSPEELKLRIFAVNSRGGMAVEVSVGRWIQGRGHETFWHEIKVGFAFEPQQFGRVLALPWIAMRL